MSTPLSIRFDPELLDRLRRGAAVRDTTPSGLAQRLVDEGLRSQEFPGVVFRDGPSGRRAGLALGPDVWEIAAALRDSELRGEEAIEAVAAELSLPVARVRTALAYYGAYAEEVDSEIDDNARASAEALRSWESQQRLLA
jgi:predicted transcriptional regulator